MKKLAAFAFLLAVLAFALEPPASGQQGYRVIVNKDNPTETLSKSDVSKYLLKKRTKWDGLSAKVEPIDLGEDSLVREAFSKDVHGRSIAFIQRYWQKQIFTGRGIPPPQVGDDAAVVSFVSSQPGAIGYVSQGARIDGVKVVSVSEN